jgi:hypothetical protein
MTSLAPLEQPLQAAKQVTRLALPTAAAVAATCVAAAIITTTSRLATASGLASASRLATASRLTTTGRLATASRLTRITAAMAAALAEHSVKQLKTIRLTTHDDTENQCAEKHRTLHRATSPLLVDHARMIDPDRAVFVTPRV